jgi:N,N'-diacetylchitobiose transport system permease protein
VSETELGTAPAPRRTRRLHAGPTTRKRLTRGLLNLAGTLTLLAFAFPVYWMFATAFKPSRDILTYTPRLVPWPPTLEHL